MSLLNKMSYQLISVLATFFLISISTMKGQTASSVHSWEILTDSSVIRFNIKNAGIRVKGYFEGLEGKILFDPESIENSSIQASVQTTTINTNNRLRDRHLRNDDYFDVEKYPFIQFSSKTIQRTQDGFLVVGDFTIKNVTKEVEIPFSFYNAVFMGNFEVDRLDYGVGKSSFILGDKVEIIFEIAVRE